VEMQNGRSPHSYKSDKEELITGKRELRSNKIESYCYYGK